MIDGGEGGSHHFDGRLPLPWHFGWWCFSMWMPFARAFHKRKKGKEEDAGE
jgi:hypothetical protein